MAVCLSYTSGLHCLSLSTPFFCLFKRPIRLYILIETRSGFWMSANFNSLM